MPYSYHTLTLWLIHLQYLALTLMVDSLQVEPFFLAPSCLGANERKRRAALLKKRNEWLSYGQKEEDLPSHLSLHELR